MKIKVERTPVRVPGFRFAGVRAGIKQSKKRDVGLIVSDVPATAAAAFTSNLVQGAPVTVGIPRAAKGSLQAIVINSGNANAYTGKQGIQAARRMCSVVASELGMRDELVIPSSTGRIGVQLPLDKVERGVRQACRELSPSGFHAALDAIMTTDAFPKFGAEMLEIEGREITIAAMTKGAGMIAPKMRLAHATNLTYLMTDAAVALPALRRALEIALPQSFNAIVVDGDTSTSDTAVLLANGYAGNRPITLRSPSFPEFSACVARLLTRLARLIVKDGEGATKVIDIHVHGARNPREAAAAADAVARSPLCKAAFFGGDPYSGRIVCALGYSGAQFDPHRIDVFLDDVQVVKRGIEVVDRVEARAAAAVAKEEVALTIHLHAGEATAHRIASDLTVDYVKFNSDYRT